MKLLRWLLEIKKTLFLKYITLFFADKKFSLFEWPPRYAVTLGKYLIQLHNLAVTLRHIMCKNYSTKDGLKISLLR